MIKIDLLEATKPIVIASYSGTATLGLETKDGTFTTLIKRDSTIPAHESRVFTTVADNQTRVEVHVLQGENDTPANNRSLAKFELTNVPPAPKGAPEIQVSFDVSFKIDEDGVVSGVSVSVSACLLAPETPRTS